MSLETGDSLGFLIGVLVVPVVTCLLYRPWIWLYVATGFSLVPCVAVVYFVTVSGDPSIEWVFWVFFGLTIALIACG